MTIVEFRLSNFVGTADSNVQFLYTLSLLYGRIGHRIVLRH